MKKIIGAVFCFGLFFIFGNGKVWALVPMPEIRKDIDINIVTTAVPTPTSILIKPIKDIDLRPIATKTPTPIIVTQVVTVTPEPTVSITEVKPTITEMTTQEPTVAQTEETLGEGVEMTEEKTDSNNWFWAVIIGLLVLILVAQVWSTRHTKSDKDKQDDIK